MNDTTNYDKVWFNEAPSGYGFILKPEDAADLCGCEPLAIIERMRTGELPGVKFGRSWVIPREAFIQRINEIALAESAARRGQAQSEQPTPVPASAAILSVEAKRGRGRPRKHYPGVMST